MSAIGRRTFLKGAMLGGAAAATGATAGLWESAALAQDGYPNKPIRFIVPLAPGGGLDFIARAVGDFMSRSIGQQIVVENRTGAGGTIGIDAAIKSPPDGYSVLVTNDNVASAPHVMSLPAEFTKDLAPISLLAVQPQVFGVHPSLNVTTFEQLLKYLKDNPGTSCATSGVGTNQHVLMEWFAKVAGVKLAHVPYRGAGQAINDLVAGHVKVGCLGPTALLPQAQANKIAIVAQSGAKRARVMPDTPTLVEKGIKDVIIESWYAAFAPAATPQPIIARLNAEMDKAMKDPSIQDRMLKTASEPVGGSVETLAKAYKEDAAKYARLVKELGVKAGG